MQYPAAVVVTIILLFDFYFYEYCDDLQKRDKSSFDMIPIHTQSMSVSIHHT